MGKARARRTYGRRFIDAMIDAAARLTANQDVRQPKAVEATEAA